VVPVNTVREASLLVTILVIVRVLDITIRLVVTITVFCKWCHSIANIDILGK